MFCDDCLLDLGAEQGYLIDQLYSRLDSIYESADEASRKTIEHIERQFPVSGIRVLETIRFGPDIPKYIESKSIGSLRSALREVFEELLDKFVTMKVKEDSVKIGFSDKGFYLYDQSLLRGKENATNRIRNEITKRLRD